MNVKELTRDEIAYLINVTLEDIAIRTASSYSTHICVNGKALCGRIDNDGYNLSTQFEHFVVGRGCGVCRNHLNRKIAKVNA